MSNTTTPGPQPPDLGAAPPDLGAAPPGPAPGRPPSTATGGFEVNPDQLHAHGRQTATFSDRVAYAKDAGSQVATADWDMAYGLFGNMVGLAAALKDIERALIDVIGRCADVMEIPVDQLPASAEEYVNMDTNGATQFKAIP